MVGSGQDAVDVQESPHLTIIPIFCRELIAASRRERRKLQDERRGIVRGNQRRGERAVSGRNLCAAAGSTRSDSDGGLAPPV